MHAWSPAQGDGRQRSGSAIWSGDAAETYTRIHDSPRGRGRKGGDTRFDATGEASGRASEMPADRVYRSAVGIHPRRQVMQIRARRETEASVTQAQRIAPSRKSLGCSRNFIKFC